MQKLAASLTAAVDQVNRHCGIEGEIVKFYALRQSGELPACEKAANGRMRKD